MDEADMRHKHEHESRRDRVVGAVAVWRCCACNASVELTPPLVACGAQGVPAPIHDVRARQWLQGSSGQRRPAPV
jgi:hypothetical protein